ncbi:PREDICTED: bZIP transcription factor 17 [Tarenaya hassleriana]|uniref:bZIP transcription factor 17 n=1 Tax=Tarenaya hassleriana TaxID=28532 RepID=UPI00053C9BEF|nr:PREDICTED: bZIP transcription factor 17 [Tarenaya hassleriana]
MAKPVMEEPPPATASNPNFSSEFDSVSIPPFDHMFLSGSDQDPVGNLTSDLGFSFDGDDEFELTFDGIDDLYFPAENETFLIPAAAGDQEQFGDFTPESEGSGISGDRVPGHEDNNMHCLSSSSGSSEREIPRDSGDRCSGAERSLNSPSPVSSQGSGSGNCASGVSLTMNAPSPESGTMVVEQKVKVEGGATPTTKRKKENEEDASGDSRTSKYRRSTDNASAASAVTTEEDEKRKARLMRNRESAQLSRQRKKHYVDELEEKVRAMHSTIADLNSKISYFMAENVTLRQQLGPGAGICPPPPPPLPPPGMYPPMAPMHHYPWMPCPPYMVKAQGSQVPLIPIPRLKPQQPVSMSKAKNKKSETKTKKVASISFLGLLFCLFLFGALAPIVNINYGEYRSNYISDRFIVQPRGRVVDVNGNLNGSDNGSGTRFSGSNRAQCGRDTDGVVPARNGSEPLVASLFVPRNDKLMKIDGNLIIHSILASEKAMATRQKDSETNNDRKTDLAIPKNFSPALPIPDAGRNGEKQKALSSGSADDLKDHFKSTAANGKMQQWFREGLAGPMLSSGMCTEVFQFDVSTSGAIVPASSASSVMTAHHKNTTNNTNSGKNRRILRGLPVPLPVSDFNLTKNNSSRNSSSEDKLGETKPASSSSSSSSSSMVVSVLVDPREGSDGDIDGNGMMGPKSLSRVFVVVLMDSVKYVTYSCVLPRPGGGPHLVAS